MSNDTAQLALLIRTAIEQSELTDPSIFEKDYYVTQVVHALADIKNDYFNLVFTGGTSLAKAHRLVMRMSEDCDFRIQSSPAAEKLNASQRRRELKCFRRIMMDALKTVGFFVNEETIKVRDSGNYLSAFLPYDSVYSANQELRADVKIEFMAINTKLSPAPKPVTTLIRQLLGDSVPHAEKAIDTINVIETAVDKWVALTRRVANTLHRDIIRSDYDLVRHIYDLYYIAEHGYVDEKLYKMIADVISEDAVRYKNHNNAYHDNPIAEINLALQSLQKNNFWRDRWDRFTDNMVLSTVKLSYDDAIDSLVKHSEPILLYLSTASIKALERMEKAKSFKHL